MVAGIRIHERSRPEGTVDEFVAADVSPLKFSCRCNHFRAGARRLLHLGGFACEGPMNDPAYAGCYVAGSSGRESAQISLLVQSSESRLTPAATRQRAIESGERAAENPGPHASACR